jgi:DNA polymerase-3 subunit delta
MTAAKKTHFIHVITGKDRYLRQQARESLVQRLVGKDQGLSVSNYNGNSVELAAVLDELRTLPFLSERRVVIVDDADKFVSDNREVLEKYVGNPSPTGVLVLICDSWRSNTRLAKLLAAGAGEVILAEPMKGKAAISWLVQHARENGKVFGPGAAESLVRVVGNDTGRLSGELEKLTLYVGSRKTIDTDDIEALCGVTAEQSIFLINDQVAEGKTAEALITLDRLIQADRTAEFSMVGVLAFSLRRLLKARTLADAGHGPRDIVSACGVYPAFADRFLNQVQRFTTRKLKTLVGRLAELDYANKTGLGTAKLNLETFIVYATTG